MIAREYGTWNVLEFYPCSSRPAAVVAIHGRQDKAGVDSLQDNPLAITARP